MPHNHNFTMTTTPDTKIHCLFKPGTDVRFNYKPIKKAIKYKYPGEGWATIYPSGDDSTLDYTVENVNEWRRVDLYRLDVEIAINGRSFGDLNRSVKGTPCDGAPLRLYSYSFFIWGQFDTDVEDGKELNNGEDLVLGSSPWKCYRDGKVRGRLVILSQGIFEAASGLNKTELLQEDLDKIRDTQIYNYSVGNEKSYSPTTIEIDNGEPGIIQPSSRDWWGDGENWGDKQYWRSRLQGISYYNTYSIKVYNTTNCKFTVTENGKTIFERTEKECPQIKSVCTEQNEQSIDINTIVPLLSGIEVKGSVESPSIPDHCIEIWRYIQGVPPTQMKVKRLCSGEGCPPPKYTVNCEPCCPPGLIEVECGNSICCYNKQGEAVKQCPK